MSLFARKPSPAMIVAVVALSFALAGSAVAGTDGVNLKLDKKEKKQVKKISKKQANKEIRKKAGGLSVANAQNAVNAQTANSANTAGSALPYAYANVTAGGDVVDSLSRNISSAEVDSPQSGVYCFQLPFQPVTGEVTPEADTDSDDIASLTLNDNGLCPASAEVGVEIQDTDAGLDTEAFYIQLGIE
jgi:hypothetical protein